MIALAVIGWEIVTWGLAGLNLANDNAFGATLFAIAALAGPLVFVPMMSKVRPSREQRQRDREFDRQMRELQKESDARDD